MQAGLVLGERYRLDERIGRGGMGQVWRAMDQRSSQPVAVKIMSVFGETDTKLVGRFRREAKIAMRIEHPGIVEVRDFGEYDEQPFIVMELLRGRDLNAVLADHLRGLPIDMAGDIALQIAEALQEAHRNKVIHRDLKPSNLFLQDDGRVKICDFGIAWMAEATTRLTTTGAAPVGTPLYMAPEQWKGQQVDERTDLYSLGCVLFALLTGGPPFTGIPLELMNKHLAQKAPTVRSVRPEVPPALDGLIKRLLAKSPSRRPSTAEFVGELRRAVSTLAPIRRGPVGKSRPTRPESPTVPLGRPAGDDSRKARSRRLFGLVPLRRDRRSAKAEKTHKAEERLRKAAEAGDVAAMTELGFTLHLRNRPEEARLWSHKAAQAGDIKAMADLSLLLYRKKELEEAERWCRPAAEAGVSSAVFGLGHLLMEQKKYREAKNWWQGPAAAGDVDAMFGVSEVFQRQNDSAQAEKWCRKAAEAGSLDGIVRLAIIFEKQISDKEIERLLQKADPVGQRHANALVLLGELRERQGDESAARACYAMAASFGSYGGAANLAKLEKERSKNDGADSSLGLDKEELEIWAMAEIGCEELLNAYSVTAAIWYRRAGLGELLEKRDREVLEVGVPLFFSMLGAMKALTEAARSASPAGEENPKNP